MTERNVSRRDLIVAGAAAVGVLTTGQLFGSVNVARAQTAKRYKVALVPKGLDNPVFSLANFGGQARATELGDVDFTFTGPARSDSAEQVAIVDGLITAGYDAIGISCCSAQAMLKPIKRALAKGITVMTWDSDSPKSKRAVSFGIDNFKAGQLQAKLINTLLEGKKGDVWIVSGSPYAANLEARIGGFQKSISSDLNISGTSFCNDDAALAVSQLESALHAHPELIGLVLVGGWPLSGSPGSLPTLKTRVKLGLQVVAFDALPAELPFIAAGTVKATVAQDYWGWGYQSVQIMHGLLTGKKYPAFVRQVPVVVSAGNLAEYQQKWAGAKTPGGMAQVFAEAPIEPGLPEAKHKHH